MGAVISRTGVRRSRLRRLWDDVTSLMSQKSPAMSTYVMGRSITRY